MSHDLAAVFVVTTGTPNRRVLIITGHHFADSARKVDLHFMADALRGQGDQVDFLVCRLSPFSRLLSDGRYQEARRHPINKWEKLGENLEQFVWFAPFHPINLRVPLLNRLTAPLYRQYGRLLPASVRARLANYTHILLESGPTPLLAAEIQRAAPRAVIIYHAADRLKTIGAHPAIEAALHKKLGDFHLIHVMADSMRSDFPEDAPILYLPHGISKAAFDAAAENPYGEGHHAVSVGDMLFDPLLIDTLAEAYPEWHFHLFGRRARPAASHSNVTVHGEVPFDQIVPFIKFADVGLAPYRESAAADYLSQSSLKMIQYTYCHLPIVAPDFAAAGRNHVSGYRPRDPQAMIEAFRRAQTMDREAIDTTGILTWDQAVDVLFERRDHQTG